MQQNFPIRTGETAFLFLQHFIKILKGEEVTHRSPQEIMDEITALDAASAEVLAGIRGLL